MWWTSKELRLSLVQLKDKTFTFTGASETLRAPALSVTVMETVA